MNLIKDNKEIEQQKEEKELELVSNIKQNIEKQNKSINFSFIDQILKDNIGNLIDDFSKTNMGQIITKYNSNMFALWCIEGFKKTKEDIVKEFNKIINEK